MCSYRSVMLKALGFSLFWGLLWEEGWGVLHKDFRATGFMCVGVEARGEEDWCHRNFVMFLFVRAPRCFGEEARICMCFGFTGLQVG